MGLLSLLLLRPFIGLLQQPWMIDGDHCGAISGVSEWQWKPKYPEKACRVPLSPPQITYEFTWARTRAAAMGSWRLTAWGTRMDVVSVRNGILPPRTRFQTVSLPLQRAFRFGSTMRLSVSSATQAKSCWTRGWTWQGSERKRLRHPDYFRSGSWKLRESTASIAGVLS
jgi:hypothetical protein